MDSISLKSQKKQRLIAFILVNTIQYPCTLKSNIYQSNKQWTPSFFHLHTNLVLGHVLIHSVDKIHVLVVTVELICFLIFCLSPMLVHLRNLFLLSTPTARMLLFPGWVSRQKDVKQLSINILKLTVGVKHYKPQRNVFS